MQYAHIYFIYTSVLIQESNFMYNGECVCKGDLIYNLPLNFNICDEINIWKLTLPYNSLFLSIHLG